MSTFMKAAKPLSATSKRGVVHQNRRIKPMQNLPMHQSPRCGAHSRRTGKLSAATPVDIWWEEVSRMHRGKATALLRAIETHGKPGHLFRSGRVFDHEVVSKIKLNPLKGRTGDQRLSLAAAREYPSYLFEDGFFLGAVRYRGAISLHSEALVDAM